MLNNTGNKIARGLSGWLNRAALKFSGKYVAVDITPGDVRALCIQQDQIVQWGSVPLPAGILKDGIILEPQKLSLVLEDLFTSLELPRKRVAVTITGLPFNYRTISMPLSGGAISQESIERAARKEMSINEPDMFIFWQLIERHADKKEADYFVAAVPKVAVRPLVKALDNARIKLYDLDIKPLALARLASTQNAILISLENKYIDIVIVAEGMVKTLFSYPLANTGGDQNRITNELVSGLDKTLKSYNRDYPESPLAAEMPLTVSGEMATDKVILKRLSEASGHTVVALEAPLTLPPDMVTALCAANLGLVLKKSPLKKVLDSQREQPYQDLDFNLLANLIRPGLRVNVSQTAAVLSAILLLSLLYFAFNMRQEASQRLNVLNRESDAAAVKLLVLQKTNQDDLAAQKAGSENLQKLKADLEALTAAQQYFAGAGIDGVHDVKIVMTALPDRAIYKTVNTTKTSMTVSGQAATKEDVFQIASWLGGDNQVAEARVVSIQPAPEAKAASTQAAADAKVVSIEPATQAVTFNLEIRKK